MDDSAEVLAVVTRVSVGFGTRVLLLKVQASAASVARQGVSGSTQANVVGGPGSFRPL